MIGRFLEPLRRRLILLFAIVLVVPSIFGILAAIDHYRFQKAAAYQSVKRYAALASNYETNLLWQSDRIAESLQLEDEVRLVVQGSRDETSVGHCDTTLARAVKPYPAYGTAILFDVSGAPICVWDRSAQVASVADREWFQRVRDTGSSTISGHLVSRAINEPIIAFGAPVSDTSGELKAIIGLGIRLSWLASVGQESGLPPESVTYLLDPDGAVLVDPQHGREGGSTALPEGLDLQAVLHGGDTILRADGVDGVARVYGIYAVGQGRLFTLFGLPRKTLIEPLWRDLLTQIAVFCVLSAAGLATALLGARLLVTRWTQKLTDAARSRNLATLSAERELRGAPVELRELGETLQRMAAHIESREAELQSSLDQKQLMLREIHHRVKNNLQIVTSLMNLYARLPKGAEFGQTFGDIQLRINALALVHRHLYESQDLQDIEIKPFMTNLCAVLQDASGIPVRQVRLAVDMPDLRLNGDRAVPLALLTTEVVTNSFKHAFANARPGTIKVEMTIEGRDEAVLRIIDDGVGPLSPDLEGPQDTLGHTLIEAFTKQLGGSLSVEGPPGTTTTLRFSLWPSSPRSGEVRAGDGREILSRTE